MKKSVLRTNWPSGNAPSADEALYSLTEAAEDLKAIRAYLKREAGLRIAQSTLKKIRDAFVFLNNTPGAGHVREDLTDEPLKFWSVFSYLIVYNPSTQPIEIVHVIHGSREISAILIDADDFAASERAHQKHPDGAFYGMRIGRRSSGTIGASAIRCIGDFVEGCFFTSNL